MPAIWNKVVTAYRVNIFQSSNLSYDRSIRLVLTDPPHTVNLQFPGSAPTEFVSIGDGFSTIKVNSHRFDEFYHILQTESPVYFTAYDLGGGTRFAGLTTDPEGTGEGFQDPNA